MRRPLREQSLGLRRTAALLPDNLLPESTLRRWCQGRTSPAETEVVRRIIERLGADRPELHLAVEAARYESLHHRRTWPAAKRIRERTDELATITALAHLDTTDPDLAYLWWHAELPTGKSWLLRQYAELDVPGVRTVLCSVGPEAGTNTASGFLHRLCDLLDLPRRSHVTPNGLVSVLAAATKGYARQRRRLVLLIDNLDADRAWPHPGTRPVEGRSIAGLLPAAPAAHLRIVVSSRRTGPLPTDVPADHPLRRRSCCRALRPFDWNRSVDTPSRTDLARLRTDPLGRAITDELALADCGLHADDLAHRTGASRTDVVEVLTHPRRHCIVQDVRAPGAFRLTHTGLVRAVLDEQEAPAAADDRPRPGTSEYAAPDRHDLLSDLRRQLRSATAPGPETLADRLLLPAPGELPFPDAFLRTAAHDLLCRRAPDVPSEAVVLLTHLDDLPRALALARCSVTHVARAARSALAAAVAAENGLPDAVAVAVEAVEHLVGAEQFTPSEPALADAYLELAHAARQLSDLGLHSYAVPLHRAVARSRAVDFATTVKAVLAAPMPGIEALTAFQEHATHLASADPEDAAAAVHVLREITRAEPARRGTVLPLLLELRDAAATLGTFATVDVLALIASLLIELDQANEARRTTGTARELLLRLLEHSETPDDLAHRAHELSVTVDRLHRAILDTALGHRPHQDSRALADALAPHRQISELGEDPLERPLRHLAELDAAADAEDNARRAAEAEAHRSERQARRDANRSYRTKRDSPPRLTPVPLATALVPALVPDGPLGAVRRLLACGNTELARERLDFVLRTAPPQGPVLLNGHLMEDLLRALGTTGDFAPAEQLLRIAPTAEARAAGHAALSTGASLGGHRAEAADHARNAACHLPDRPAPATRNLVAQALAHAGEADLALDTAARPGLPRHHYTTALIADGLTHHTPDLAAHLLATTAETLRDHATADHLPTLAALLHTRPPGVLTDALRTAARFSTRPYQSWPTAPASVLGLLLRLDPSLAPAPASGGWTLWRRSLQPAHTPYAAFAVLAAFTGDTVEVRRLSASAPSTHVGAQALGAAAHLLSGAPALLPADPTDTPSLLVALGSRLRPADTPSAADPLLHELLTARLWSPVVPSLPRTAPQAITPLAELLTALVRPAERPETG
ncbi:hypothetical protein [Kitasatospora sp. NPDC088134]|uniref:hypothetical protein n=1 Tax=Kitasatospora sp. NPDC088134 TaxID=3364071 RepID=UPI00382E057D